MTKGKIMLSCRSCLDAASETKRVLFTSYSVFASRYKVIVKNVDDHKAYTRHFVLWNQVLVPTKEEHGIHH